MRATLSDAEAKELEQALAYTIELDCLPMDLLLVQCEIARWKGDVNSLQAAVDKYKNMEYDMQFKYQVNRLEKIKSNETKAVDLTFVPETVVVTVSNEEKIDMLDQAIRKARAEMDAAAEIGDDDAIDIARAKAKQFKKEKKALKLIIEKAKTATSNIDQAKIDEIKSKIKEARQRENQAFDDDDEDAEEAAAAEVKELTKQLRALTGGGSIPKQKLEDAKKKDANINS